MATIQVRDVPEEVYEILRGRARRAGQSLQAYMLEQVIAVARRPTKDEAVARIEAVMGSGRIAETPVAAILEALAEGRR